MNKTALLLLFFLKIFCVYSQNNKNIELIDFSTSQCDKNYSYERQVKTRIVSKNYLNGIFNIEIGIFENCGGVYNPKVCISSDTLKLLYEIGKPRKIDTTEIDTLENGEIFMTIVQDVSIEECDCYFLFTYSILGIENRNYVVTLNNEKIEN